MRTTAIVCAALAGTLGFGSIASAQQWDGRHERDGNHRQEQRHDRGDRGNWRQEQRVERRDWNHSGWQAQRYAYEQPRYAYNAPRYYRGGYLPREYYRNPGFYVSNWQAYPGLYAPPYGYQWVNVDGNLLLVALATGLIANALIQ